MKTKKYFISAILALFVISCSNVEEPKMNTNKEIDYITVSVQEDSAVGRTNYDEDLKFTWANDDVIAIYAASSKGDMPATGLTNYHILQGGSSAAAFKYNGFKIIANNKYYAFWPYMPDMLNREDIKLPYSGQVCDATNINANLSKFDYLYSAPVVATADDVEVTHFTVKRVGAFIKFHVTVPEAGTYRKIRIKNLYSYVQLQLKETAQKITKYPNTDNVVEYSITNLSGLGENGTFDVRYMVAQQAPDNDLEFTLIDKNNIEYTCTLKGPGNIFEGGERYILNVPNPTAAFADKGWRRTKWENGNNVPVVE